MYIYTFYEKQLTYIHSLFSEMQRFLTLLILICLFYLFFLEEKVALLTQVCVQFLYFMYENDFYGSQKIFFGQQFLIVFFFLIA